MNDDLYIAFADTIMNIQRGKKISIHHAVAVSDEKFNKITARPLSTHFKKNYVKDKKKGIFHLFSKEVLEAVITVAVEGYPLA